MKNIVLLFSGQGSQTVGMGEELYNISPVARNVYQIGSEVLGYDISKLSFSGDFAKLSRTKYAQPAIFALSVAAYETAKDLFEMPVAVAGHSLGEYAALQVGGAYSLEDGFRIVQARADAMERAGENAQGCMYAVMKLPAEQVSQVCSKVANHTNALVEPVNFNTPEQTVISGEDKAVKEAAALLQEQGARVVPLAVSSAFHTRLMEPAAKELTQEISQIKFKSTNFPFYSNLSGGLLEITDYPSYFAKHMTQSVKFTQQVKAMGENKVQLAVEFGPGKTVANLVRRNNREIKVHNVEDKGTLSGLFEFLR